LYILKFVQDLYKYGYPGRKYIELLSLNIWNIAHSDQNYFSNIVAPPPTQCAVTFWWWGDRVPQWPG